MPNFSGILECIFQVTCLLDLECIVRDHNEELGLYVGGIVPHILHCSFYMIYTMKTTQESVPQEPWRLEKE